MYTVKVKKRIAVLLALSLLFSVFLCFSACKNQEDDLKREEIFNNSGNVDIPDKADETYQSLSVCLTPPSDAKSPEEYSALENIGFMVGRLMQQKQFHTDTIAVAEASALFVKTTQRVFGSKDFKDGILIVSTVSTNSMTLAPSKALQRYHGSEAIIVRGGPQNPTPEDWKGADTAWSTGEPFEILPSDLHSAKYGLCPMEISDYVIREDTILTKDAKAVADGDGFKLTVSLSVEEKDGMADSTKYYKCQMMTMGELSEFPKFESVQITFNFEDDWTVNSLEVHEKYSSKKGITAKCEGTNRIAFSYGDEAVNVSAYDTYFSRFV